MHVPRRESRLELSRFLCCSSSHTPKRGIYFLQILFGIGMYLLIYLIPIHSFLTKVKTAYYKKKKYCI